MALLALSALLAALASSCQSHAQNPDKPHHTADGFRNNHPHESHGFLDVMKWRWDGLMGRAPERPDPPVIFPLARNDPDFLRENRSRPTITWIGHATLLLQIGGLNLLTDPQFSERASPFSWMGPRRITPPGLPLAQLPMIDAILISHNHYDHLDLVTLSALQQQQGPEHAPRIFVPLGVKAMLENEGFSNVVELDWWDSAEFKGLTIHAAPAQHFSARTLWDTNETLWAGWVVRHPSFSFYFAGDTGYSPDFLEIKKRLGPFDLAALPIGAYEPRWFMGPVHLNPAEAVQVHKDLNTRYSVAMHWGTFDMTDEAPSTPPKQLAADLKAAGVTPERFFLMQHGETRNLEPLTGEE